MSSDKNGGFQCRPGCAACCIAASISSPIPGLPGGKPAGIPCPCLTAEGLCAIYNSPERPAVCSSLQPEPEMCGSCREEAIAYLSALEKATCPQGDAEDRSVRKSHADKS